MSVILNNYFGRQFNSLNDVAINPRNKEMYFTDVTYGWLQDFRPIPILPNQVYRFNPKTGLVGVVADGFDKPNGTSRDCSPLLADQAGITFSPDGTYAYIADTGAQSGPRGQNFTEPATMYVYQVTTIVLGLISSYQFTVNKDGTWGSRQTFAFVDNGVPDGTLQTPLHIRSADNQVFIVIPRDTSMLVVVMVSMSGTRLGSSSERYTWV
jgi:gluconolactonase